MSAGDASLTKKHVATGRFVHVGIGEDVGDRKAPARPQHARRLAKYGALVSGEIDHAVGDDHVHRAVGKRDLLVFFSSRRRHTRYIGDWSSDVCSSDLGVIAISSFAVPATFSSSVS